MWLIPCCTVQFQFFWYVFKTLPSFWKFFGRQDLVLRSGKQWSHHSCKQKNKNASEAKREGYNSDVLIRALCWYKFVFASAFVSAKMSYEWGYPCIQSGYLLIYRVLDTKSEPWRWMWLSTDMKQIRVDLQCSTLHSCISQSGSNCIQMWFLNSLGSVMPVAGWRKGGYWCCLKSCSPEQTVEFL